MTNSHVVVVDDDPTARGLITAYLSTEAFKLSEAATADELEQILATVPVDLVLLDIVLPSKDGFSITRELRSRSNIGIIVVSSRTDDYDRILGLEMGADDYVSKPFVPRELLARVRTVLRRVKNNAVSNDLSALVRFDEWMLDLNSRTLIDPSGTETRLTTGEFVILSHFVQKPGTVIARDRLAAMLGADGDTGNIRSVDVLISRLRRKLNDDSRDTRFIVTVHREGYIFTPQAY